MRKQYLLSFIAVALVSTAPCPGAQSSSSLFSRLSGSLELRPSWISAKGSFHSENEFGLEYQVGENRTLGYVQEFRASFYNPKSNPAEGLKPSLGDGYLRAEFADVLRVLNLSVTYEPRFYLPTSFNERAAGFLAGTRQYLKFNFAVSQSLSLFFWEVPILAAYSKNGFLADGEFAANRQFENRIELGPLFSFFQDTIKLKMPLILQSLKYPSFHASAKNNDSWVHQLAFYPEVLVRVAKNTQVGLAYCSDSLIADDFSRENLGPGFKNGVIQFVLQQSL